MDLIDVKMSIYTGIQGSFFLMYVFFFIKMLKNSHDLYTGVPNVLLLKLLVAQIAR